MMIFSCGGLKNVDPETRERLVDEEDDARSTSRLWFGRASREEGAAYYCIILSFSY